MLTAVLLMVLVLAVGAQLSDGIRLEQEAAILRKLPVDEAHAYYEVLRRRARRVRLLRAIALASLAIALYAARRRFLPPPSRVPVTDSALSMPGEHAAASARAAGGDGKGFGQGGRPGGGREIDDRLHLPVLGGGGQGQKIERRA
jgi:hypothetical protein